MLQDDLARFRERYDCDPPNGLPELLNDDRIKEGPVAFSFRHRAYLVEIQYPLDIFDPRNHNSSSSLIAFAVTTDGYLLHADARNPESTVVQQEGDDYDEIGVSLLDLLAAECKPLSS